MSKQVPLISLVAIISLNLMPAIGSMGDVPHPTLAVAASTTDTGSSDLIDQPIMQLTGPTSQIVDQRILRICDAKNWDELWLEHLGKTADQAFNDSDMQCLVDFNQSEVVAIFQGNSWNSRGLRVLEFKKNNQRIRIRYERASYQTSGVDGGGVRVSPYIFLVLPKTAHPIDIEENTQGLKAGAKKWTHRAHLKTPD